MVTGKLVNKRTDTAYNLAVADWFGQPKVLEINASSRTGQIGQTSRILAKDDTYAASVHVVIDDANGNI